MKHQSGRSMVEILGVLAVIGVLSVGGLAAYNYAMDKKVVNDLMYDMELATTEIWTSGTTGPGDLGEEMDVSVLGENHPNITVRKLQHVENGEIVLDEADGEITEEDVAAVENGEEPAFSIEIHDITVAQCVQLLRNQDKLNTPFLLKGSDGTDFDPEDSDDPQDFCERIFGKDDPVAFGLISNAYAGGDGFLSIFFPCKETEIQDPLKRCEDILLSYKIGRECKDDNDLQNCYSKKRNSFFRSGFLEVSPGVKYEGGLEATISDGVFSFECREGDIDQEALLEVCDDRASLVGPNIFYLSISKSPNGYFATTCDSFLKSSFVDRPFRIEDQSIKIDGKPLLASPELSKQCPLIDVIGGKIGTGYCPDGYNFVVKDENDLYFRQCLKDSHCADGEFCDLTRFQCAKSCPEGTEVFNMTKDDFNRIKSEFDELDYTPENTPFSNFAGTPLFLNDMENVFKYYPKIYEGVEIGAFKVCVRDEISSCKIGEKTDISISELTKLPIEFGSIDVNSTSDAFLLSGDGKPMSIMNLKEWSIYYGKPRVPVCFVDPCEPQGYNLGFYYDKEENTVPKTDFYGGLFTCLCPADKPFWQEDIKKCVDIICEEGQISDGDGCCDPATQEGCKCTETYLRNRAQYFVAKGEVSEDELINGMWGCVGAFFSSSEQYIEDNGEVYVAQYMERTCPNQDLVKVCDANCIYPYRRERDFGYCLCPEKQVWNSEQFACLCDAGEGYVWNDDKTECVRCSYSECFDENEEGCRSVSEYEYKNEYGYCVPCATTDCVGDCSAVFYGDNGCINGNNCCITCASASERISGFGNRPYWDGDSCEPFPSNKAEECDDRDCQPFPSNEAECDGGNCELSPSNEAKCGPMEGPSCTERSGCDQTLGECVKSPSMQ